MTLALAAFLGLLIGLTLGALGGGGSILTVPALVYAVGEPARAATTASLVIVGVSAAVAVVAQARAGHVRWRPGLALGAAGVAASFGGTAANRAVPVPVLLSCFAGLMVLAAVAMLAKRRGSEPVPEPPARVEHTGAAVAVRVLLVGLVVGFLTGFLGVGGGFIVVPALVLLLRYPMAEAVGTSLLVITLNSGVGLLARTGSAAFHWSVIVPFTVTAVVGSLAGHAGARRVSGERLTRAFAGLLLSVAAYVAVRVALG